MVFDATWMLMMETLDSWEQVNIYKEKTSLLRRTGDLDYAADKEDTWRDAEVKFLKTEILSL